MPIDIEVLEIEQLIKQTEQRKDNEALTFFVCSEKGLIPPYHEFHPYAKVKPKKKMPAVYLIADVANNVCKIGYSTNVKKRIKTLQTSYPHQLTIISAIHGDKLLEEQLHNLFSQYRLKGEWFILSEDIAEYFQDINAVEQILERC